MSTGAVRLTDRHIEQLLLGRSFDADQLLLNEIRAATEHLPQRGKGWLPLPMSRRTLALVTAALLLAALAGVVALAARQILPEPEPAPGPDGGWIVYVEGSGVMYLADLTGNASQIVMNGGHSGRCPAFSPDGRLLAYGTTGGVGAGQRETALVVAIVDRNGIAETSFRVAIDSGEGWAPPCPKWSPDGEAVAFLNGTEVWVAGLDGEVLKLALDGARDLAWTPDSSALLVLRGSGVIRVPLDGSQPRILHETAIGEPSPEYFESIVVSPTAAHVAVIGSTVRQLDDLSSAVDSTFLRVIDAGGSVLFEESRGYSLGAGTVAWSPDGSRLAWVDRGGLRIRSLDAAGETTLFELPAIPLADRVVNDAGVNQVAWSPDGRRFLLNVSTDTGPGHAHAIVSIAADGSGDVVVHSEWTASLEVFNGFGWQPR